MAMIDIILISNFHCMLALPYITEYTNFSGVIYATEPTLHIGRYGQNNIYIYIYIYIYSIYLYKMKYIYMAQYETNI